MTSVYLLTEKEYEGAVEYPSLQESMAVLVDDFFELYIEYAYPVIWNKLYRGSLVREHQCAFSG